VSELLVGPRVGIDYATPEHVAAPWRLAIADSAWVSQRKKLKPLAGGLARFLREQAIADAADKRAG
jgi:hypothetical protein